MSLKLHSKIQKGFTILELLIVVAMIAILALVVYPRFVGASAQAEKSAHKAMRQTLNAQLELYFFEHNKYPVKGHIAKWKKNIHQYFPDGPPKVCNHGAKWIIESGRVAQHGHEGHE